VFVAGLPAAPAGSAYEMWTIGDGAPQPAGLFKVDASGRGTHRIAAVEDGKPVKVFAITLEPEAGVPAPTGPMMLASK
jgi:anti-sigma-K factor RskA